MDICGILVVVYFIVGVILALYWFKTDYAESYKSSVENGTEEKGMTCIFLLLLIIFWPIKLVRNLIKKRRI
jgi:uncharacterized membrane protein YphA (DoxX/SURF4 family)